MSTEILPPRPRGRSGGRPRKISDPAIVAAVPALCRTFNISRATLYRVLKQTGVNARSTSHRHKHEDNRGEQQRGG
jgi:hypothetical protein